MANAPENKPHHVEAEEVLSQLEEMWETRMEAEQQFFSANLALVRTLLNGGDPSLALRDFFGSVQESTECW